MGNINGSSSPEEMQQHVNMEKLKRVIQEVVRIDDNSYIRIQGCMQLVLYGKFLGKTIPFDQVREALLRLRGPLGSIAIVDLLNGFYILY